MTMAHLAHAVRDDRVMNYAAVVRVPLEGGNHWDVINGQLLIHVVGKNTQTPYWAHACGTRLGRGRWEIPDPGTEVLVGFDDGDSEGDAFLIATFGRSVPDDLDATTTIIQDTKVIVRDAVGGTASPLATLADIQALRDWVNDQFSGGAVGHTHTVDLTHAVTLVTSPYAGDSATAPTAAGTQVLEGQ